MYCVFLENRTNVVFWFSQKAGCTYVKSLFLRYVGIDRVWPHQLPEENLPETDLSYHQEIPNPVHILFIRNPFKRIVSGFLDKMVRKPGFPVDRDGFKVAYEIDDEMTFESFIQSLENHHIFSNPHFSNQASIAYDPDIRFDRVFDIERIDTDYLDNLFHTSIEQPGRSPITLYRHYDGEKPVCQLSIRELDQLHFKPAYRQFYNPAIRNKIEELYEKDFRLFERLGFSYKID